MLTFTEIHKSRTSTMGPSETPIHIWPEPGIAVGTDRGTTVISIKGRYIRVKESVDEVAAKIEDAIGHLYMRPYWMGPLKKSEPSETPALPRLPSHLL